MVYALVTHDFSVSYVAQVGSRATPLFYTVISLWGALEGSILFWAWVLSMYAAAVVWINNRRPGNLVPYAAATLLFISFFFAILLVGPANPFGVVFPVPPDGPGPEPAAAEPHPDGGAPAAALPGLRRHVGAVRVRGGRDALRRGRDGRLDRRSRAAGRSRRGRSSRPRSSPACGGRTKCSAGAATGRGIPSRTRRSCRGSRRPRSCIR